MIHFHFQVDRRIFQPSQKHALELQQHTFQSCCNNERCDWWQNSNYIVNIFEQKFPVSVLSHCPRVIGFGESASMLEHHDRNAQLGHWMHFFCSFLIVSNKNGRKRIMHQSTYPILRYKLNLFFSWYFTSYKQPKQPFWKWLMAIWCLRKQLLALLDCVVSERIPSSV